MDLAELNGLPEEKARAEFLRCCGSRRWAQKMAMSRPFADLRLLLSAARENWRALAATDWLEAFSHHPRIGQRNVAEAWAKQEQSSAAGADEKMLAALAQGNEEYEKKFGFIYLVCATGKSAAQMLDILRARLQNDPPRELGAAASEQEKIMELRLAKLLD